MFITKCCNNESVNQYSASVACHEKHIREWQYNQGRFLTLGVRAQRGLRYFGLAECVCVCVCVITTLELQATQRPMNDTYNLSAKCAWI